MIEVFDIKTKGHKIPCILNRCADDKALILVHGFGSNRDEVGDMFKKLAAVLAAKGISSLRFDLAGCGKSSADVSERHFENMVKETKCVYSYLREIGFQRIGILGFSLGARIALAAMKDIPFKIFISWSGAIQDGIGLFQNYLNECSEQLLKTDQAPIAFPWRDDLILPRKFFDDLSSDNALRSLSKVVIPALFVFGKNDQLITQDLIATILKNAHMPIKKVIINDGDHTFSVLDQNKIAENVLAQTASFSTRYL